jgi:molybdenum cofactor biosynthesis enzyme MoaA
VTQTADSAVMVDWFITDRCNDTCKFCYAPLNYLRQRPSVDRYLETCHRIAAAGFKRVTLCGGDPTVAPQIERVVDTLRALNLEIVFYTNAIMRPLVERIAEKVGLLSLALEYPFVAADQFARSATSQRATFELLERFSTRKPEGLRVKVGTVVHRRNLNYVPELHRYLKSTPAVDLWRLYQFSPAEMGRLHSAAYLIADEEFEAVTAAVRAHTDTSLTVSFRSRRDNIGYCLIMNPWGDFFRYEEDYVPVNANLFTHDITAIVGAYDLTRHLQQKRWTLAPARHDRDSVNGQSVADN